MSPVALVGLAVLMLASPFVFQGFLLHSEDLLLSSVRQTG